ncbi:MAG: DUF551 domain-containing protein [Prevotellaceae bacterium]|jgi:hypothetical protein|nr:DUF551 domain-containing protein [Prevotellaceae bacterium]
MKTIEEAAHEYFREGQLGFKPAANTEAAFIAGVKFAQRWISVKEELPPCSDEDILIKGIDYRGHKGVVDIGYMHEKTQRVENFISLSGEVLEVTHWRPIELK